MHITEDGVNTIAPFSATRISEEDSSAFVSLCTIKISPINCDILNNFQEVREMVIGI